MPEGPRQPRHGRPPSRRPAERLRERLELARSAGVEFPAAWSEATTATVAEVGVRLERQLWTEALHATRPEWEAAYRREPADAGVRRLAELEGAV